MKYIIFDSKYPVIFPDEVIHCEIKLSLYPPTSAGEIVLTSYKGVCCFGESGSLGLKSKKEDSLLIKKYLYDK